MTVENKFIFCFNLIFTKREREREGGKEKELGRERQAKNELLVDLVTVVHIQFYFI